MKSITKLLVPGLTALTVGFFLLAPHSAFSDDCGLGSAKAEAVGFSTQRLKRLDEALRAAVGQKTLPGAVVAIARHGKVVDCTAYGYQDTKSAKPMRVDSIFSIASMTKPIIGVAMMILYEDGKWQPEDPVEKYIPELANLKVFSRVDSGGSLMLEDPKHPPTIAELMTHTAGFTYGIFGDTAVDKLYQQADPLFGSQTLKEFAEKLGKLPLLYQPGEKWIYSVSVDVQALLVERLSGKALPDFLQERIFDPLGMKDTSYYVPEKNLSRLATIYSAEPSGTLKPIPPSADVTKQPTLTPGGHGLFSTVADYLRFCQTLLNGGELDGVRILSPSSVQLMRANHLPERLLTPDYDTWFFPQPGQGFGYDVAVDFDPSTAGRTVGKGTYFWLGFWGTWFWIDPTNDVIFVGMMQRRLFYAPAEVTRALTYQALVRP
jgi:CubicO group peptidase (beta-lactamase class C family)